MIRLKYLIREEIPKFNQISIYLFEEQGVIYIEGTCLEEIYLSGLAWASSTTNQSMSSLCRYLRKKHRGAKFLTQEQWLSWRMSGSKYKKFY